MTDNMDEAIRAVAICQMENEGSKGVFITLQANGDVLVSTVDLSGTNHVAYARVDRMTKKLTRLAPQVI